MNLHVGILLSSALSPSTQAPRWKFGIEYALVTPLTFARPPPWEVLLCGPSAEDWPLYRDG